MRNKIIFAVLVAAAMSTTAAAQYPILIHSHNDYAREVPFYQAYAQRVYSIEADLFLVDGELYVAHDMKDIKPWRTFDALYVQPLVEAYRHNGGRPYADLDRGMQLMVEIKGETDPMMDAIVASLSRYPEVFDPSVNEHAAIVAITGNIPAKENFCKYPSFIFYDGEVNVDYSPEQLERVALISTNFRDYSTWNGKGSLKLPEAAKVRALIDKVHSLGKPIRFWGAPESVTGYYTFLNYGIDYMNTDCPEKCADFYSDFANKNFVVGSASQDGAEGVTGTHKLDKATRAFSGFRNDKLSLSAAVPTYSPTFESDGKNRKIRNVIYLIGDGMGMNQITAAAYANLGLSLLHLKNIGFQFNNASDEFTTDSAAAGSALATGEKHSNRHIASREDGQPYESLSDYCHAKGMATGVVTLGDMADATPTAFYAHNVERDNTDEITSDLIPGHLDLLCGSGMSNLTRRADGGSLVPELRKHYNVVENISDINAKAGRTICIDERMGGAAEEANLGLLAESVEESIAKLQSQNKKGFFLMVEGAKIDYAGHSMCMPGSILENLSFDMAVAKALEFADRDGHTLVVITADHETGGLTLLDGTLSTGRLMGVYVTDDHTPAALPVFAYGPYSYIFNGVYNNNDIPKKIKKAIK